MINWVSKVLQMVATPLLVLQIQAVEELHPLPDKENFHIYLVIGDGEMAGHEEIEDNENEPLDRFFLFNARGQWEPATYPLNRYSSIQKEGRQQKQGLSYFFAKEILERNPDISIGLVVNAGVGQYIDKWGIKSPPYWAARSRTQKALKDGTLKGVLWKSKTSKTNVPIALDYLKDLFSFFRADMRNLDLPVVVCELEGSNSYNNQLRALASDVHAIGIAKNPDNTELQGKSCAEEMSKLLATSKAGSFAPAIPVIDVHVHAQDAKVNGLEAVAQWMKRNNVDICISHPLRSSRYKNDPERRQMLTNYKKHKGRIYRFCLIEPGEIESVEEAIKILEREKAEGAIGMGEHYGHDMMFDDPRNLRIYEACEKVDLPVMFHIDRNKNMDEKGLPRVERVLKMFPNLKLLAHASWWAHLPDGSCERLMQKYPNLYADVSAITKVLNRDRNYTRKFIIRNQDRILFATDAGWWSFGKEKEQRELEFTIFERLDLPESVKKKIYQENAERLFGFERN